MLRRRAQRKCNMSLLFCANEEVKRQEGILNYGKYVDRWLTNTLSMSLVVTCLKKSEEE